MSRGACGPQGHTAHGRVSLAIISRFSAHHPSPSESRLVSPLPSFLRGDFGFWEGEASMVWSACQVAWMCQGVTAPQSGPQPVTGNWWMNTGRACFGWDNYVCSTRSPRCPMRTERQVPPGVTSMVVDPLLTAFPSPPHLPTPYWLPWITSHGSGLRWKPCY